MIEILNPYNPNHCYKKDSTCYNTGRWCLFLLSLLWFILLYYFSTIGLGVATNTMINGYHTTNFCYYDGQGSFYWRCFLLGIASEGVVVAGLLIISLILYGCYKYSYGVKEDIETALNSVNVC